MKTLKTLIYTAMCTSLIAFPNIVLADNAKQGISDKAGGWLATAGTIVVAFVGVMALFRLAKNAWEYFKGNGQGSLSKIVLDFVILAVMIGLAVIISGGTAETWGKSLAETGKQVVDMAQQDIIGK